MCKAHSAWPKITLVTPSYNQAQFLEEAILSVLSQGYPNLEYIVMDGGSTDGSVAIIEKYSHGIAYWQSRPDGGQASAIEEALSRATGEWVGWLNSDDTLLPNALFRWAKVASKHREAELLIGGHVITDENGVPFRWCPALVQSVESLLCRGQLFGQMACLWKLSAHRLVGGLDTDLRMGFDYDLFLRLIRRQTPRRVPGFLATFRLHAGSKTCSQYEAIGGAEDRLIRERHGLSTISRERQELVRLRESRRYTRNAKLGHTFACLRDPRRIPGDTARLLGAFVRRLRPRENPGHGPYR